jgi:hypothetical protein
VHSKNELRSELQHKGGVDAAGDNCVTDKLSMTSPLVPLASNDLLYRAQVGRADHSTLAERATTLSHFNWPLYLVARDGGHFDDMTTMARLLFSKSGAV